MTIEEYSNRLFAAWGIGGKRRDNGVLLLVVPHDKTVRIEVGYGLEEILPDGLAGEVATSSETSFHQPTIGVSRFLHALRMR